MYQFKDFAETVHSHDCQEKHLMMKGFGMFTMSSKSETDLHQMDMVPRELSPFHLYPLIYLVINVSHIPSPYTPVKVSCKGAHATEASKQAYQQFLDNAAAHPDAITCYRACDMILKLHSNSSYLNALGVCS